MASDVKVLPTDGSGEGLPGRMTTLRTVRSTAGSPSCAGPGTQPKSGRDEVGNRSPGLTAPTLRRERRDALTKLDQLFVVSSAPVIGRARCKDPLAGRT